MNHHIAFLIAASLAVCTPAWATPNQAHDMVLAGEIMPLEPIQRRIVRETPGEYVGVQFDPGSKRYRFRFMQDGNVINVDVDARTGERLRRRQSY